jgi:hypothetical protein
MTSVRHLQKTNVPFSTNLFGRRDWGPLRGGYFPPARTLHQHHRRGLVLILVRRLGGEKPVTTARRYRTLEPFGVHGLKFEAQIAVQA